MSSTTNAEGPVGLNSRGRLLDAAETLLDQASPPRITLDRVATAAGLSRTTAYRIFGTNAEMAGALAAHRLHAHRKAVLEIAKQGSDAITRIEDMAVHSLVAIVRDPVLSRLFEDDDLMNTLPLRELADEQLRPVVEEGQSTGDIRRDLATDEIVEWLLEVVTALARQHHSEETLHRRYSLFVRPGLMPRPPTVPAGDLLDEAELKLCGALDTLDELRGIAEPRNPQTPA
ncbi:MAG: TetR/AcrR family transcriptional regulator [Mycobacterium sp.]